MTATLTEFPYDLFPLPTGAKKPPPRGVIGYEGDSTWNDEWLEHTGNWAGRLRPGFVGIDIDGEEHGAGKNGPASVAAVEADLGPLPATVYSTRHGEDSPTRIALFRVPEGVVLTEKPLEGVEIIQPHHRYMVVAPSVVDDKAYQWFDFLGSIDGPQGVADLPAGWVEYLRTEANGPSKVATAAEVEAFMDALPAEGMGPKTERAMADIAARGGADSELLWKVIRGLGAIHEDGSREAVDVLHDMLEAGYYHDGWARQWPRAVEKAVARLAPAVEVPEVEDWTAEPDDDEVMTRARQILFERNARRLADELEVEGVELEILSSDDLRAMPAPEFVVDGLLYQDTLAVWAGTGSVGKTATLVGIALAMGNNLPFLGQKVRQGRVLFLEAEGVSSLQHRIGAWNAGLGQKLRDDHIDWIKVKRKMSPAILRKVRDLHLANRYDLVVIDTMSSTFAVESENDNAEVSRLMSALKTEVRDAVPGTCAVLVHHTTNTTDKSGKTRFKARGASAYRDDADTVIIQHGDHISQTISTEPGDSGKQRDAAPHALRGLCLRPAGGSVYVARQTDEDIAKADGRLAAFIAPLKTAPLASGDWQQAAGMKSDRQFQELRSEAIYRELVVKDGGSKAPYTLTEAGAVFLVSH